MFPNEDKINMVLLAEQISVGLALFAGIIPVFKRSTFIVIILILLGLLALNIFLRYKLITCPNCRSESLFFANQVLEYYYRRGYYRNRRQKPPECPHCGKTYGEYSNK